MGVVIVIQTILIKHRWNIPLREKNLIVITSSVHHESGGPGEDAREQTKLVLCCLRAAHLSLPRLLATRASSILFTLTPPLWWNVGLSALFTLKMCVACQECVLCAIEVSLQQTQTPSLVQVAELPSAEFISSVGVLHRLGGQRRQRRINVKANAVWRCAHQSLPSSMRGDKS